ncbi:hypothetical protein [Methylobacterium sp. WL64]|nr:hypothetical protein [Methylobacterium sp. WL64]
MADKTPSWTASATNDARVNRPAPVISPGASTQERQVKNATFNAEKRKG